MFAGFVRLGAITVACAALSLAGFSAQEPARGDPAHEPPAPEKPAARHAPYEPPTAAEIDPDGFTSARVCGECHTDIYDSWKNSLHAFSLTDPIFDTAFMQAIKEGGEEARRTCLGCHAPMTLFNEDYALREGVTREGVACDFCHSVTAVHIDNAERPYEVDPGTVKRGVIKHAASPAHDVAYSELHATSEFCGGCHNYTSEAGAAIMTTYQEWKEGPYAAEGVQCQDCHMVLTAGSLVNESIMETRDQFHLHSLIHDRDQLKTALTVEIISVERHGDVVEAQVAVENVGSGHMVPTGVPSREVVLRVTASSDRRETSAERRFRKVVVDADGMPLEADYQALLYGAKVLNDTRIPPRGRRVERVALRMPGDDTVRLRASVYYVYAPAVLDVERMNIELATTERYVR